MEQNGPCQLLQCSSVYPCSKSSLLRQQVKEIRESASRMLSVFSLPSCNGSTFIVLVVVAMLLCQPRLAESTLHSSSLSCPEQCLCWNVTAAATIFATRPAITFYMDCSNGSLQGFLEYMSKDSPVPDAVNATFQFANNGSDSKLSNDPFQHNGTLPSIGHDNEFANGKITSASHDNSPSLVNIDLSFNNVSSLYTSGLHEWKSAHRLKQLNLSHNGIESLDIFNFQPFKNLVILDLSNNLINAFTPDVFRNVPSLERLYLHNNRIANINLHPSPPGELTFIPNLVHLDLSHNRLPSLPSSSFSSFPLLSHLNLTHNHIAAIDQFAFTGLSQLHVLLLSHNNITRLDYPVFQDTSLVSLWLDNLPHLSHLSYDVFQGLSRLQYLNLSHNIQFSFLHHDIISSLQSLQTLDLSGTNIRKISSLTFRNNPQVRNVYLQNVPLSCQCTNAWLVEHLHKNHSFINNMSTLHCHNTLDNQSLPIADALFSCNNVSIPVAHTEVSVAIGSVLSLQCQQQTPSDDDIIVWTTPRGYNYYYHPFHLNASQHLLSPMDVQPSAPFHKDHDWHQSSSYYSELNNYDERILVLSDGSLFIDYILRSDAGSYRCVIKNAHFNDSASVEVQFSYKISGEVKIFAIIVGILCAVGLFTLNLIYVVITWLARRLVNKRRREHIRQMLENLNSYKSTQITRIYENYTCQLNRVRNRYHVQRDRLHKNYTMQVDRVKRGCSHQVEKVRDNYTNRLTQLREYSSSQIVQIREMATNQIGRIRDYGSLQLDRLRETYKLQHLHMMKLLDTMNLDNCRSIVETECMRTESMMYDLDLLSQEDVRIESPFSMADNDSEYNTATSSPLMSVGSQDLVKPSTRQMTKQDGADQYDLVGDHDRYFTDADGDTEPEQVLKVTRSGSTVREGEADRESVGDAEDDIQIEMNTVLHLPDNVRVDAKEVWTYGKGDESTHTLYTKIDTLDDRMDQPLLNKLSDPNPSLHKGPTKSQVQPSECCEDNIEQEESPTRLWEGPPPVFHYDGYKDCTIVHLYDADGEEDEDEEEKTETDTMV